MHIDEDQWNAIIERLRRAEHVVVFTGAGASAESGVPTFRDEGGFWTRFPPERFANWEGLYEMALLEPRLVAQFVHHVVDPIARAEPNPAHVSIAGLGQFVRTTVITQNIDGLHQAAGSTRVLEVHGCLQDIIDRASHRVVFRADRAHIKLFANELHEYLHDRLTLDELLMTCSRLVALPDGSPFDWSGRHRPNIVLFGDGMAEPAWSDAYEAAQQCDVMLCVGTSGEVYPAAMLPHRAHDHGALVVSIDPQPADYTWIPGRAGEVVPRLIDAAFGGESSEEPL